MNANSAACRPVSTYAVPPTVWRMPVHFAIEVVAGVRITLLGKHADYVSLGQPARRPVRYARIDQFLTAGQTTAI